MASDFGGVTYVLIDDCVSSSRIIEIAPALVFFIVLRRIYPRDSSPDVTIGRSAFSLWPPIAHLRPLPARGEVDRENLGVK